MALDAGPVTVKVVPEIDSEALRDAVIEAISGHAVVKAGETLVVQCRNWGPEQVQAYQAHMDSRDLPFPVLVVIGDELAVATADGQQHD